MSKKASPFDFNAGAGGPFSPSAVKDSAQQIWLAGLGAFAKAQEEGSKVFDALVKEGLNSQGKTQAVAEEKIAQAAARMSGVAADVGARATGQWDKLEGIFEERVGKALARLGMPTLRDLEALAARVEALEARLAAAPPAQARTRGTSSGGNAASAGKAAGKAASRSAKAAPAKSATPARGRAARPAPASAAKPRVRTARAGGTAPLGPTEA